MRRLSATGTLLLAVAGLVPASPARASGATTGTVAAPSPVAGTANATMTAMSASHCHVGDPAVTAAQGGDGFAIDMGGAVSWVDLVALDPGTESVPADLDVYFLDDQCAFAGALATTAVAEHGQPQQCVMDLTTWKQTCVPTTPRYAVVTMTTGVNAAFSLAWS